MTCSQFQPAYLLCLPTFEEADRVLNQMQLISFATNQPNIWTCFVDRSCFQSLSSTCLSSIIETNSEEYVLNLFFLTAHPSTSFQRFWQALLGSDPVTNFSIGWKPVNFKVFFSMFWYLGAELCCKPATKDRSCTGQQRINRSPDNQPKMSGE